MPKSQDADQAAGQVIPVMTCPRCRVGMRLAIIEPAAKALASADLLIFECTCGFTCKQLAGRRVSGALPDEPLQ